MSISENLPVVRGQECLQYINKPIGFKYNNQQVADYHEQLNFDNRYMCNMHIVGDSGEKMLRFNGAEHPNYGNYGCIALITTIYKWFHDPNKRVVGLIRDASDDGGIHITILGNETITNRCDNIDEPNIGECGYTVINGNISGKFKYTQATPLSDWELQGQYMSAITYPSRATGGGASKTENCGYLAKNNSSIILFGNEREIVPYDQANNYTPTFRGSIYSGKWGDEFQYAHGIANGQMTITNDPDNTVDFGCIFDGLAYDLYYPTDLIDYPNCNFSGNLYNFLCDQSYYCGSMIPLKLPSDFDFSAWDTFVAHTVQVYRPNYTAIPFNLILTTDYSNAIRYLQDGTLPFDAKLYPLDWENLPSYDVPSPEVDPDDPEPDDTPDDTIVDPTPDDVVDVDPDVDPTTTVQNLCNYNLYWLQADQWSGFINWFWHDISAWSGFDDLINSIQGLYNDLGSAVIMCRYMPVNVSWIGGLGDDENIKLGMIEKTGNVNTISKRAVPIRRNLGEITINQIVSNNFLDFSPYSQLSLYLPLHGFVDLDMNIFQGHKNDYKKLIIQGIYDLLSGTLQYLIYVKPNGKDKALVNSFVVKIAQDIPLTLQTKNDRDSMIFGNVASTVGGLLGAGASIATGNPIGIAMGSMNAVNTLASAGSKSAPMSVKGTTGEMGGLYAPERPMIILRRAAVQPSDSYEDSDKRLDTWKSRVGRLSGYGQPMGSINGYVQLAQPRIKFTHNIPLQSEIDELYQILQQGFVCSTKS